MFWITNFILLYTDKEFALATSQLPSRQHRKQQINNFSRNKKELKETEIIVKSQFLLLFINLNVPLTSDRIVYIYGY